MRGAMRSKMLLFDFTPKVTIQGDVRLGGGANCEMIQDNEGNEE